jgi:hypothetical protein
MPILIKYINVSLITLITLIITLLMLVDLIITWVPIQYIYIGLGILAAIPIISLLKIYAIGRGRYLTESFAKLYGIESDYDD